MSEYQGRHMRPAGGSGRSPQGGHRPGRKRRTVLTAALAVLALASAGATLAWFNAGDAVTNMFVQGKVDPSIEENFGDGYTVKKDVKVKNEGTMRSYVRAAVSIYWQDGAGNQLWEAPEAGFDYAIVWGDVDSNPPTGAHWITGKDGYYYWSEPLERGASTGNLINKVEQARVPVGGKKLVVDISSQALQAEGTEDNTFDYAWGEASGLAVSADGSLVARGAN